MEDVKETHDITAVIYWQENQQGTKIYTDKQGMSEERVRAQLDNLRKLFSFFREYPDLFIDFIKGKDCNFKFYTYQRVFLRQVMRYRYVYATYPRAYEDAPIQFNKNCGQTFLIA